MKFKIADLIISLPGNPGVFDTCQAASCSDASKSCTDCSRCSDSCRRSRLPTPTPSEQKCFRPDGLIDLETYRDHLLFLKEELGFSGLELDKHISLVDEGMMPSGDEELSMIQTALESVLEQVKSKRSEP